MVTGDIVKKELLVDERMKDRDCQTERTSRQVARKEDDKLVKRGYTGWLSKKSTVRVGRSC